MTSTVEFQIKPHEITYIVTDAEKSAATYKSVIDYIMTKLCKKNTSCIYSDNLERHYAIRIRRYAKKSSTPFFSRNNSGGFGYFNNLTAAKKRNAIFITNPRKFGGRWLNPINANATVIYIIDSQTTEYAVYKYNQVYLNSTKHFIAQHYSITSDEDISKINGNITSGKDICVKFNNGILQIFTTEIIKPTDSNNKSSLKIFDDYADTFAYDDSDSNDDINDLDNFSDIDDVDNIDDVTSDDINAITLDKITNASIAKKIIIEI